MVKPNKKPFWKTELFKFVSFCIVSASLVFAIYLFFGKEDEKGPKEEDTTTSNTQMINRNSSNPEEYGICPTPVLAGDGVCDDDLNIPICDFDLGDCCSTESNLDMCEECKCHTSVIYLESPCLIKERCPAMYYELGDGNCDLEYNNENCYFDLGDCCFDDIGHCIKSSMYCITDFIGDGFCHEFNNGPQCNFDGGDCCDSKNTNETFCCHCNSSECPIEMIFPGSFKPNPNMK